MEKSLQLRITELKQAAATLTRRMDIYYAGMTKPKAYSTRAGTKAPSQFPELRAIIGVLRACIRGDRGSAIPRDDLQLLAELANDNVTLRYHYSPASGRCCVKQWGSLARIAIPALENYTAVLSSDPRLKDYEPIIICPHCGDPFLRTRKGQDYCSDKCRVSHWGVNKGKQYFADAQRRRRAGQKKTVGIKSGELSEKSRETKGKPKKK